MSVGKFLIELPTRAAYWAHAMASREKMTAKKYLERLILQEMYKTPGVDFSRSPKVATKGKAGEWPWPEPTAGKSSRPKL